MRFTAPRRHRFSALRSLAVTATVVLAATACGGSDDAVQDSDRATTTAPAASGPVAGYALDPDVAEIADASVALVQRHGDVAAFDAVAFALERGYSGGQILSAALDNTLEADGMITELKPEGDPAGAIELTAAHPGIRLDDGTIDEIELTSRQTGGGCGTAGGARIAVEWLRCRVAASGPVADPGLELGSEAVFLILWLATTGYGAEQITEALLLGGSIELHSAEQAFDGPTNCLYLRSSGRVVVPSSSIDDTCYGELVVLAAEAGGTTAGSDRGSASGGDEAVGDDSESAPSDEPASTTTFAGPVDIVHGALTTGGERGECSETAEMRLTVYPDRGRVFGEVVQAFSGWEFVAAGPPLCRDAGVIVSIGGTIEGDTIELFYYRALATFDMAADVIVGRGELVQPASDIRYQFTLERCESCEPVTG